MACARVAVLDCLHDLGHRRGGMDRNMEALTRRNEDAASSIRVAIEHLTDVVRSKPPEDDASLLSLLDQDGDVLAKLERARDRVKLRGDDT